MCNGLIDLLLSPVADRRTIRCACNIPAAPKSIAD
jgi:hypothetical protein